MRKERRERQQAAVREEIKATAWAEMARHGAAGLSLRAVASTMGLSSAAIYYYYPNRDALITDLIIDAYGALGAVLRNADPGPDYDLSQRLAAILPAYRHWAIGAPAAFELIFGAPIPGYHAPADQTTPAARAALAPLGELFGLAYAQGRLRLDPTNSPLPTALTDPINAWSQRAEQAIPAPVMLALLRVWALGHGLVALELNGQTAPLVGDPGILFEYLIHELLADLISL